MSITQSTANQVILDRLRAEYLEMPGLRLKAPQVGRLCGIERALCEVVLDILVEEEFLCRRPDGSYARPADGIPRPRPAKAALRSDLSRTANS